MHKLHEAVLFATKAHENQLRKAEPIPYITHPYTAALYALPHLRDYFNEVEQEEIIIAILLHDVLEDTQVTEEALITTFGENVTTLVKGASEVDKSKSWMRRKTETIRKAEYESLNTKFVICADKVHNLISMLESKERLGEKLWESFKENKDKQYWYYSSLYSSLIFGMETIPPLFKSMEELIEAVFK